MERILGDRQGPPAGYLSFENRVPAVRVETGVMWSFEV